MQWMRLCCVLMFLLVGAPAAAQEPPVARIYLPAISSPPLASVTAFFYEGFPAYPTYYSLSGQVTNLTTVPLSVTVEIDMLMYPYLEQPYTYTMRINSGLEATLPGESNPFFYSWLLGKASIHFIEARVVGAVRLEGSYHSLTVVERKQDGNDLVGIVRNDVSYVLENLRVVVDGCELRRAQLASSTLQPGETTSFRLTYCIDPHSRVITQGKARLP